jgi:hypothetical protein
MQPCVETHDYKISTWEAEAEGSRAWDSLAVRPCLKNKLTARCWWLTPVILATQEAEIRRISVQSQRRQILHEPLSQKKKKITKGAGGVDQGVGPEFKSQNCQKKSQITKTNQTSMQQRKPSTDWKATCGTGKIQQHFSNHVSSKGV